MWTSPAGRCRSSTATASRPSTSPCAPARACSTSRTWARSRSRGPEAQELLQRLVSNDVRRMPEGGAQYSLLCNEDGGVLDDLFTYRLAEGCFLTVTNAANHERDLEWMRAHADGFDADLVDRARRLRDARRPGPASARARRPAGRRRAAAADALLPARGRRLSAMLVCGTGYTGEDGVELLLGARRRAGGLGRAAGGRRRRRSGSAHATRCGSRRAFTCTATTSSEDRGPIEAGLGWACREETGFIGSEAVAAVRAGGAGARSWSRS